MQPMNYNIDVADPFASALKGYQTGQAMQQQQAAQRQAQASQQQSIQMQQELSELSRKPDMSANDVIRMTVKYPQLAEHFKSVLAPLSEDQKQNKIGTATQVYAALQSGNNDVATSVLEQQLEAAKNSGNAMEAAGAEALLKMVKYSPESAKVSAGLMLASTMGDKFASTFGTLQKTPVEIQKIGADIRNTDSQIANRSESLKIDWKKLNLDAERLNLDKDKLQSDVEMKLYELKGKQNGSNLDASGTKILNDSAVASVTAAESANTMRNLADRLEKAGGGNGIFGSASEKFKELSGSQDAMTDMRKEYLRLRNSGVLAMLPPGSASDKDIELALSGFPPANASTKQLSGFLRGMAKLQDFTATAENVKSEWVNNVGNLGKAKQDLEIDGVKVPAGMTYSVFAKKYIGEKVKSDEKKANVSAAKSYWEQKYPTTGASGGN